MRNRWGQWSVAFAMTVGAAGCWVPEPLQHEPTQEPPGVGEPPPPMGPKPQFGVTRSAPVAPPPLSGGTLWASDDGTVAVAADPDVDAIYVIDLGQSVVRATIALAPGDEPGRIVVDAANRAHVALRRGGAVMTIDLMTGVAVDRTAVCSAPRGLAYDAKKDAILVACAGGELVTLPAAGGAELARVTVERDLRDVVIAGGLVYVTKLRTAELLQINPATGAIAQRQLAGAFSNPSIRQGAAFTPSVAWRTTATADGTIVMVHERATTAGVQTTPNGYGGGSDGFGPQCDGILHAAVSTFGSAGVAISAPLPAAVLPLDVAVSHAGDQFVVVAAGNSDTNELADAQVFTTPVNNADQGCGPQQNDVLPSGQLAQAPQGQPIAVAMMPDDNVIVQTRLPAGVELLPSHKRVEFPTQTPYDTGHAIFHANAGGSIACASCHAEGGDDARTWQFVGTGPRRTQSLREGITGTEPFHWDGEMTDLSMLVHAVFVERMSGPDLDDNQLVALRHFLDGIPRLPAITVDADQTARGQLVFGKAGCTRCHAGAKFTTAKNQDVGTGGMFQVPSLVNVAWRAPYLHDGRAPTLAARFDPKLGGGDKHGKTSNLSQSEMTDLVAFLESL